jgi:2-polyprenyl-3-methyl-5-hydroxy-6-metoxy-1,4-benzoquinol methylase
MEKKMSKIMSCEVCGSSSLEDVLDLGMHPLCDDLINVGSEEDSKMYQITIGYCNECCTAHQLYQVQKKTLFPVNYHYRSRFTSDVLKGMDDFVNTTESIVGNLKDKVVLDIGCNDGSLLDKFSLKGSKTIGVEPTSACKDASEDKHILYNEYFDTSLARKILDENNSIDIITFTNVFAHIENLTELLDALSIIMNDNTLVMIENHYLGAILEKNQFDTFYHEHPRTYSLTSFIKIAERLNNNVVYAGFPSRYGGNIRVGISNNKLYSNNRSCKVDHIKDAEKDLKNKFKLMRLFISKWVETKKGEIDRLVIENGPLVAKAFPGRAAILIRLLDLSEKEILCVYEKPGSLKIHNYIPGTRIEIRSDDELFSKIDKVNLILNLAWHISDEIEGYLNNNKYTGEIINIV